MAKATLDPRLPASAADGAVLVAEAHPPLARVIAEGLSAAGYTVEVVADGGAAADRAARGDLAALVLDRALPDLDGPALARLRDAAHTLPVVLLLARDAAPPPGLEPCAVECSLLVKPFSLDELLARLRAAIHDHHAGAVRVLTVEDLRIDTGARRVHRGEREVPLSSREYAVLECLALHRGRIVSRDQLLAHVYPDSQEPGSNIIDVYVGHLRRKIDGGCHPRLIHTRRGLGYLLGSEP